ncbi:MAG: regulatory protein RecX [Gammaproteobacteria bacterium]|nr:regulatory protein RecX [Gammaproteobacteria bacterium]
MANLENSETVRNAAVRLLARREHSRRELAQKLAQRGHPRDLIEDVIDGLADAGMQSDERFVETFVRAAVARGQGPLKLRARLRECGIEDALASAAIDRDFDDWRDLASSAVAKRFGPAPPGDRADWAKRARFLASRGISSHIAPPAIGDFEGLS